MTALPVLRQLPPLSLYIHIPWCLHKCPYCDFNSYTHKNMDEDRYINALLQDLAHQSAQVENRQIQTIYIGGGTPSLLSPTAIQHLMERIHHLLSVAQHAEVTMEANPGTINQQKLKDFAAVGITRLSIGVQSFNDYHLSRLGRIHNAQQAQDTINHALAYFDEVNIDIIYALPDQTINQAVSDINQAIASGVQHISAYHLTLEPHTQFARTPPANLPDDDLSAEIQDAIESQLTTEGFEHYEISAFAQTGYRCQHNINYWQYGDYLGIGAGAHGKLSTNQSIQRDIRYRQPAKYMHQAEQKKPIHTTQLLAADDLLAEFMINVLRLTEGFHIGLLTERTGLPAETILQGLNQASHAGFVSFQENYVQPTPRGLQFLNDLSMLFI